MKFINRKEELEYLYESYNLSKIKLFSLALYGLRRVGKTRLIEEFIEKKGGLYFFVAKNKTSITLLKDFESTLKEKKIISEFEKIENWDDFFKILFERYKGTIVFDEFQNFFEVEKAVFSILQKSIDLKEERKELLFIFSGSIIGLTKKIFRNGKEALYGRVKREFFLKPLSFNNIIDMGKELKIKDTKEIIELYALFGGFPKYYVAIEDEKLKGKNLNEIFERFFLRKNAVFEEEVERILSLELGKRKGRFYDILTAIAQGNTRISGIANYLSIKETKLSRYLDELINYFEIVSQEKQVIGNKSLFVINNPIINLWFRFFYKNLSLYRSRNKNFLKKIKKTLNSYIGKRFEKVCEEFIKQNPIFEFDLIGKQWGKIPKAPKGENTYEIDICAINEKTKEILFAECKWKNNINPEKVIKELKEKSKYVDWHNDKRKEYYAVFAKSFSKKIKEKGIYLFDLKNLEKTL